MVHKHVRAQYTREFKVEAVRQVRAGHAIAVVAKVLGLHLFQVNQAALAGTVRPVLQGRQGNGIFGLRGHDGFTC